VDRPGPLRETVRATLEDLIVHGTLDPGAHLREEVLAERLQVSRQPIREALQHLAQDRFVELRQGRGAFVRVPTRAEIDDVFDVRSLLEAETARLAARRITQETLDELREICVAGAAAVASGDKRRLVELNSAFHGIVMSAAGNQVLGELLTRLEKRISWYFSTIVIERSPGSWQQHEDIYAALAARDGQRAADLMVEHVTHTRARLDAKYEATP
jgi:DNA-binding GntR family transcriptional regulator